MLGEISKLARTPLEFSFGSDKQGAYAQQITRELDGKSNLLMDAVYMPSSEDTRHKIRRDESTLDTAITVASDQGHPTSAGGHQEETYVELGLVADGCEFDSIQEENAPSNDVAMLNRQDISDKIESVHRKDAYMTVYGDRTKDPKGWDGLAYYTRQITARNTFESNFYAGKIPFEGEDLCLTLDNQADATTALTSAAGSVFSSIYAVVWDPKYVAKIYGKESKTYGISTYVSPETTVQVPDETGRMFWHTKRMISFRKQSGVSVGNRFGLIRVANICFDKLAGRTNAILKEEYERLCTNMAFVEEIYQKLGIAQKVKFYAPESLIRKMRTTRALGNAPQSQVFYSIPGVEQAGQIHGIMAKEFYLNDNYLITPEFQMLGTEAFVPTPA